MAVKDNPAVGYVNCRYCGVRCSAHQNSSTNAFFYTRFCSCDPKSISSEEGPRLHPDESKHGKVTLQNQIKSDDDQQYIYDNLERIEGVEVRLPPHLERKKPVISKAKVEDMAKAKQFIPEEFRKPEIKPEIEPESEPEKTGKGRSSVGVVILAAVAVAGLAVVGYSYV